MARRGTVSRSPNGTWELRIDVQPPGAPRKPLRRRFPTRAAAEAERNRILHELDEGSFVGPSRLRLIEYLDGWLPTLERQGLRLTTIDGYERQVKCHIRPYPVAHVQLQRLAAKDLDDLYDHLLADGKRSGGGLAPSTVRGVHEVLSRSLGEAERKGLVRQNVAKQASPPSATSGRGEMKVWEEHQVRRFLRATRDDDMYPIWHVALMTGMRLSELIGLRWSRLDLDRGVARVVEGVTWISGRREPVVGPPKTAKSRRSIDLDEETVKLLRRLRIESGFPRRLADEFSPEDLVFPSHRHGGYRRGNSISTAFRRAQARHDMPRIRFHDLRHTHATLMLQVALPHLVSARLGHSSVAFTLQTYAHVLPMAQAEAAERFADRILRARIAS